MNKFKKEITMLKREVARLQKMLNRSEETEQFYDAEDEESDEIEIVGKKEKRAKREEKREERKLNSRKDPCPNGNCKGELKIKEIGPFEYRWCDDCRFREKVK